MDPVRATLTSYLQSAREALVWKLDGLTEEQVRRPMTPTGTNLLGLIKHCTYVENGYLGEVFGRPVADGPTWEGEADPFQDMYATADESMDDIIAGYRRAWEHADATIAAHDLSDEGSVWWWPEERRHPSLHRVITHVLFDLARHAGHADILRERIDGAVGLRADNTNMATDDPEEWAAYVARLDAIADRYA